MTHNAANAWGVLKGGKTATGTVPGGASAAALAFALGGSPPPGWPGWGTSGGAMPGWGLSVRSMPGCRYGCGIGLESSKPGCSNGCDFGLESSRYKKAALTNIPTRTAPKIAIPVGMQFVE